MFRNYLKTALRNLLRQKGYTFINLAGLTLGMASCLLIFQFVAFEYSYDDFNKHADHLYRATLTTSRNNGDSGTQAMTGYALAPALDHEIPAIVRAARLHPNYGTAVMSRPDKPSEVFEEEGVFFADPAFLKMFTYRLVVGDTARALAEPGTVLLSESAALKYFGTDDPTGKTLDISAWIKGSFRVNGVFQDVPANSHLRFDFLLPIDDLLQGSDYRDAETGWTWNNSLTYLQLREGADVSTVEAQMTDVLTRNRGESFRASNTSVHMNAQPLRDIHLNSDVAAPAGVEGSYRTVYFFIAIGVVVLLIALVNYVNLATARSQDRAREVGVRKVVGAKRRQLAVQFLVESALTIALAVIFAVGMAAGLRPVVSSLAGVDLPGAFFASRDVWLGLAATTAATTLLAGLYPAFVLSSFRPISVLKAKAGAFARRLWLRQGLVVLQFVASIVLLVGTVVVYRQLGYVRTMDLGLDLEQVIVVPGPRVMDEGADNATRLATFRQALGQVPGVQASATSGTVPGEGFSWYTSGLRRATADPGAAVEGAVTSIDSTFAHLYGLELVAGEGFRHASFVRGEGEPVPVLANETAVTEMGFDSPAAAIDQFVVMGGNEGRIVGVLRDFNWSSAHTKRENILFTPTRAGSEISIRLRTKNLPNTLAAIEPLYAQYFPGNPFRYTFVDEQFEAQYRDDERFASLFGLFAGLAVAIACLGLFGLASFATQQRRKEIGVRKVLGATVPGIVGLLARDFIKLVLVAVVIAVPAAYLVTDRWLDSFAYRTEITWEIFVAGGLAALVIALLTVSYQSLSAAVTNPVETLQYE